ncbi:MAG: hypothetical protein WC082_11945 [Victivallales bacterium]
MIDELTEKRIKKNRKYRRRLADEYAERPELGEILEMMLEALDRRFYQIQMESWNDHI